MTELAPQTVTRLVVTQFKRLTDVAIVPDADTPTVQITGRNAQGKSSVLDALETVFTGVDKRSTPKPIHEGSTTARIVAETQDLVITRTFKDKGGDATSTLTVAAKDGAKYGSPQKMLDDLYGMVTADPWDFATKPAKDQKATLLNMVELPFDLDALDSHRAHLYAQRTDANRKVRELEGQWAGLPEANEDVPEQEHSITDLLDRIRTANEHKRELDLADHAAQELHDRARQLREELARVETQRDLADAKVERLAEVKAEDPAELTAILTRFEDSNREIRENARVVRERAQVGGKLATARAEATSLDENIAHIDQTKAEGLAQAKFPVPGLGFTEDGITYQGQPFEQASTAERIRVSFAVATAKPGKIRVVLIRNGESLDSENLKLIGELAKEAGFQVWIEKVSETRELGVFMLEDGRLAE